MKIAIVEDDINMRKSLEISLSLYKKYEIKTFKSAVDALKKLDDSYDLIITDINMPKMDGLEFIKKLNGRYEVIIMTANATLQRAIESIQMGVKDFLLKPFEVDTLVEAIERSAKVQARTKKSASSKSSVETPFVGNSPKLEKLLKLSEKAAKTEATILLLGESGVGKEVFAKHIHAISNRSKKPFVALNMAAIPENLVESELFGYEKGAFTDATSSKEGLFEAANGGTIFLDEIGEMPYNIQAKLLRAIQEREIQRLGSSKKIKIDIRIISATNANLHEKIASGAFREDLYYRLNTIPLEIPPLRERVEEIMAIAQAVLQRSVEAYNLESKSFSKEAKEALLAYKWPGNIRELISVVERATILSDGECIESEDLFLDSRSI